MSELSDLTVAELKELLKEAGLPVSGKKADLIARLEEADIEEDVVEEEIEEEEKEEETQSAHLSPITRDDRWQTSSWCKKTMVRCPGGRVLSARHRKVFSARQK